MAETKREPVILVTNDDGITAPGIHNLVVRATDRKGQLQPHDTESIYPSGAAGYHTRQITVQ